jgi:hypothetical protein
MEVHEIERLIKISNERPLLPDNYIPWLEEPGVDDLFLPEVLTTLEGLSLYPSLTQQQRQQLGRHEVVQVLYSYGWGESLFCIFMSRYCSNLPAENPERRFLEREIIEEYRHQEMFAQAIVKLNGNPIEPTFLHKFIGEQSTRYLPADYLFMGSVAVELVTDMYGNYTRRAPGVYVVLRKVFELHGIEEGRHIHFTKGLLEKYTAKAGYLKRSLYSLVILMNIYFIRSMYIKKEIYNRIDITNADDVYQEALTNYRHKFTQNCLGHIIEFVDSWKGFNTLTRWAWRLLLKAKV